MIISISIVQISSGWIPSFTSNFSKTGERSVIEFSSLWDFRIRSLHWAWRTYFPMTLKEDGITRKFLREVQILGKKFPGSTHLSSTSQASKSFLANGVKKNRQTWKPVSQRLIYLWAVVKAFISFDASDDEL